MRKTRGPTPNRRSAQSQKFFEVQPYFTESNHGYLGYMVIANAKFWKDLPPDVRTTLEKILAEVTVQVNATSETLNAGDRQKIKDSGKSEILPMTAEQRTAWQQAMKPVYDKFSGKIGKDVVEAARAANQP